MKKVAIITIWDLWNLGNRLQNYAVTNIAKKKGLDPVTINTKPHKSNPVADNLKYWMYRVLYIFDGGKNWKIRVWFRAKNFREFTEKYIPNTVYTTVEDLNAYDYLFIGSDQIWNAEIIEPDQLSFGQIKDTNKVVCVSPSFGVAGFENDVENKISGYLNNLKYVNVREHAGAEIVKRLTGKDVPVFIDPTLMLTADEWKTVEKKPHKIGRGKFILKYFLGEESEESLRETEELCNKYGYEVIKVLDKDNTWAFSIGPAEFLYLIHHAEIILTDSFHACVFSILYRKSFWVYSRVGERMNSRLDTLFNILKIDNRFEHDMSNPFNVDYSNVDGCLEMERQRFNDFIDAAIAGR